MQLHCTEEASSTCFLFICIYSHFEGERDCNGFYIILAMATRGFFSKSVLLPLVTPTGNVITHRALIELLQISQVLHTWRSPIFPELSILKLNFSLMGPSSFIIHYTNPLLIRASRSVTIEECVQRCYKRCRKTKAVASENMQDMNYEGNSPRSTGISHLSLWQMFPKTHQGNTGPVPDITTSRK